jgi:cytochrome c-type biogenesis protein CcmH
MTSVLRSTQLRGFLFALGLCCFPIVASAQTDMPNAPAASTIAIEQEARANEIINEFMSPFCPGRLLRDCPSSAASELKQKIRDQIAQGKSRAEVEAFLVSLYGNQVWAAPPTSGFGLVAWIAPAAFLCIGLVFVALWMRGKHSVNQPTAPPAALDPKVLAKIEEELRR